MLGRWRASKLIRGAGAGRLGRLRKVTNASIAAALFEFVVDLRRLTLPEMVALCCCFVLGVVLSTAGKGQSGSSGRVKLKYADLTLRWLPLEGLFVDAGKACRGLVLKSNRCSVTTGDFLSAADKYVEYRLVDTGKGQSGRSPTGPIESESSPQYDSLQCIVHNCGGCDRFGRIEGREGSPAPAHAAPGTTITTTLTRL